MLMALLVLAFAGQNVRVDSGAGGALYGGARFGRHVGRLLTEDGRLSFDMDSVRVAARAVLIDVLSCRRGMSNSGVVSRLAGEAIGADSYLPNMGSEEFLASLSRQGIETVAKDAGVEPRPRVRETRSALVAYFEGDTSLVHKSALFAPEPAEVLTLLKQLVHGARVDDLGEADDDNGQDDVSDTADTDEGLGTLDDHEADYGIAAQ
jgi:ParB family chromosome partitioning protein